VFLRLGFHCTPTIIDTLIYLVYINLGVIILLYHHIFRTHMRSRREVDFKDCDQFEGLDKDKCEIYNEGLSEGKDSFVVGTVRELDFLDDTGEFGIVHEGEDFDGREMDQELCESLDYNWFGGNENMCITGEEANSAKENLVEWGIVEDSEALPNLNMELLIEEVAQHGAEILSGGVNNSTQFRIDDIVEDEYDGDHGVREDLSVAYDAGVNDAITGDDNFDAVVGR